MSTHHGQDTKASLRAAFAHLLGLARRYHRATHRHQPSSSRDALGFVHRQNLHSLRIEAKNASFSQLRFSLISLHYNESVHCHHRCCGSRSGWIRARGNLACFSWQPSSGKYRSQKAKASPHRRMSRDRYVFNVTMTGIIDCTR